MTEESPIIQLKKLTKIYKNGMEFRALDNANLRIKKGEFVAIVGPSGSGKSTLMHMIGLLDTPSSGTLLIDGKNVTILKEVGLEDRMDHKPGELSGGQNQRVAVARALNCSPSIMLGNKPTGNLDTKTGDLIYELLRRLNREYNQTFIVVTHNENLASKTDRIIRLVDGKITDQ